ncbi:hypothetical protein [Aquibium sp. ELW1220]|jgi:hypothetical protein|uniref:hypothetical protein n=1 Tax=Aquibium sp. ELW1220 TaxID=2976766 RepID=UPI0025AF9E87|nr:hypothetical protein [Aquibium sp. ELW1220]MDN2579618.1 hypothetical protein [Aquibium sp. ELW1220]
MAKAGETFFRPLWRRVAIVAVSAGWAVLEWTYGDETWTMIAAAVTAYGAWSLLYSYKAPSDEDGTNG